MAWEEVFYPRSEGDLGIRRLKDVSRVFALQLIWKILTNSGFLWVAWVRHYLLRHGSFWDVKETMLGSWIWRKLLKLRPLAAKFIRMELHNEKSGLIWSDYWHPLGRLIDVCGEVGTQKLGIKRFARISEVAVNYSRRIRRCHDRNLQDLIMQIQTMPLPIPDSGEDEVLWRHAANDFRNWFSSSTFGTRL